MMLSAWASGSSLEPAIRAAPNNVVASACEFHNLRKECRRGNAGVP
jgi:hypothetical protein